MMYTNKLLSLAASEDFPWGKLSPASAPTHLKSWTILPRTLNIIIPFIIISIIQAISYHNLFVFWLLILCNLVYATDIAESQCLFSWKIENLMHIIQGFMWLKVIIYLKNLVESWASIVAQMVKNLPTMWETWVRSGRSPGGGHGNPLKYSCLVNPHGQRSLASYSPWCHRVSHDWVTNKHIYTQ